MSRPAAKALTGTASAVLLGATTSFPDVLHALERLRVPAVATTIAALMYRYLFVIADETRRMRSALTARAYRPRHLGQAGALGRLATALFLRSHDRGDGHPSPRTPPLRLDTLRLFLGFQFGR